MKNYVYEDIADVLSACILDPGQIFYFKEEKVDRYIAVYAIKLHYEINTYQLYCNSYYNASSLPGENEFSPAGLYIYALNTLVDLAYPLAVKTEILKKSFNIVPSYNALVKELHRRIKVWFAERYIAPEKGYEILKERFDYEMVNETVYHEIIDSLTPKTEYSFKFYCEHADNNKFEAEDFADMLYNEETALEFSYSDVVKLLLKTDCKSRDDVLLRNLELRFKAEKDNGLWFVKSVVAAWKAYRDLNEIHSNPNHQFNKWLRVKQALVGKSTVTFELPSGDEFKIPANAFILAAHHSETPYINLWALTDSERKRFNESIGNSNRINGHVFRLVDDFKIKYRGKVIYDNKEEFNV